MFLIDADYFVTAVDATGRCTLVNVKTGEELEARLLVNLNHGAVHVVIDPALLADLDARESERQTGIPG